MNIITGKVWKFGDNIDTDIIIAARYLNTSDPHELAKHIFEDQSADFHERLSPGDILIAGSNFGCGSSREHAPIALKAAGIGAIIAKSFARIFYRNAFNMGLPIFELNEVDLIMENDLVRIDLDKGKVEDLNRKKSYDFFPIPEFMQELIASGGLINFAKSEILKSRK